MPRAFPSLTWRRDLRSPAPRGRGQAAGSRAAGGAGKGRRRRKMAGCGSGLCCCCCPRCCGERESRTPEELVRPRSRAPPASCPLVATRHRASARPRRLWDAPEGGRLSGALSVAMALGPVPPPQVPVPQPALGAAASGCGTSDPGAGASGPGTSACARSGASGPGTSARSRSFASCWAQYLSCCCCRCLGSHCPGTPDNVCFGWAWYP